MTAGPLGLLSAIPQEFAAIEGLSLSEGPAVAGIGFLTGTLEGRPVVAAESGIGKVHAAMVATMMLDRFGCRALLFSGVAGGLDPTLAVGDVVIADRLVMHDYGAMAGGRLRPYQPGVPPLPGFPEAAGYSMSAGLRDRVAAAVEGLALPALPAAVAGGRTPRLVFGTVLTGDYFLNDGAVRADLFQRFGGAAVEMEGAALAAVAERFGIPVVVVRALSDLAGEESHMDFPAFLHAAAASAAAVTRRVAAVL